MKFLRRQFLHLAAGAAAVPAISRIARAQAYPSRPVRVIAPAAAGGGIDITARLIGQWLSERLGQQFIVEDRPGAGVNIGTETVVHAPPDGYTLLLASLGNAVVAALYEKLNYNFVHDITPVAGIMGVSNVVYVHPSVPAKTIPEFIAYAKAWFGTPYTEALHLVERYRLLDYEATKEAVERGAKEHFQFDYPDNGPRPDPDYNGKGVQIQLTVEDEGAFTMPWSATVTFRRALDEWVELVCPENPQWHPGTNSEVLTADKPDF